MRRWSKSRGVTVSYQPRYFASSQSTASNPGLPGLPGLPGRAGLGLGLGLDWIRLDWSGLEWIGFGLGDPDSFLDVLTS